MRPRLAPTAARIATSRWRANDWARSRFATLTQAMIRIQTTAPNKTSSEIRISRTIISPSETTLAPLPATASG